MENEGQWEKLGSDQNSRPKALETPRSRKGQEKRERKRCQVRSDYRKGNGEEQGC